MILILESSSPFCSVALVETNGTVVAEFSGVSINAHAEQLPEMALKMQKKVEDSGRELKAIAVSAGPGSYTGLRIGTSLAKGVCYAMNLPLLSADPFMALYSGAKEAFGADLYFCAMDARRDEVYCKIFNKNGLETEPIHSLILDEYTIDNIGGNNIVIAGNCEEKVRRICHLSDGVKFFNQSPHAMFMANEICEKFARKQFEDLAYYEPTYLKEFAAGKSDKFKL